MSDPISLPTVSVVGQRTPPSDAVALVVNGRRWEGWTNTRVTRGIERLPSDFEVQLTEFAPGQRAIQIRIGDAVEVLVGNNIVLTGWVDRITRTIDARAHAVTITGRSKCADLVDCAAEWKGGQISGANVLEVARTLAAPYGIEVSGIGDMGPAITQFNLSRGETPFQILERLCRFAQLLMTDTPDGNLLLSGVSTDQAASGLRQGVNVVRASFTAGMDQRFSEVRCFIQSMATLDDMGEGGDLVADIVDEAVPRHRLRVVISETSGAVGWEIARQRAAWEVSRRFGRSNEVRITTDSWRDRAGRLYSPNSLALVELPSLQLPSARLTIGEVCYRSGDSGTLCDLVLMPSEAFKPMPFNVLQLLPFAELADIAVKVNPTGATQ